MGTFVELAILYNFVRQSSLVHTIIKGDRFGSFWLVEKVDRWEKTHVLNFNNDIDILLPWTYNPVTAVQALNVII